MNNKTLEQLMEKYCFKLHEIGKVGSQYRNSFVGILWVEIYAIFPSLPQLKYFTYTTSLGDVINFKFNIITSSWMLLINSKVYTSGSLKYMKGGRWGK